MDAVERIDAFPKTNGLAHSHSLFGEGGLWMGAPDGKFLGRHRALAAAPPRRMTAGQE